MANIVFTLCSLLSMACAVMLLRSYFRTKVRFLMWSSLCFTCLAINNILLFIDKLVLPEVEMSVMRILPAVVGMVLLVYGLIWETE